jgi:hypothetical protein
MTSSGRLLSLLTVRTEALHLLCSDTSQLVFWWAGLQDLASVPQAERVSRGTLLWRVARALYHATRHERDREPTRG